MSTWVLNFANSIVGVGILAVPFCFHVCGIGMAILMVLATNLLTRKTCEFLLKAGQLTRKTGYESLAQYHLGPIGKLITELGVIGLMLGTLISFQVVIGDLAPTLINSVFGVPETWSLRTFLMCLSAAGVIPLGLMRNISSLANMNAMSMGFYCIFIVVVFFMSTKNLFSGLWYLHVNFWRPEGFFHCLPIISLSFSCQTQVFVMYEAIPDPSVNSMMDIVNKAINLVTVMYISVGTFGYIAFYETGVRGDILANFPGGLLADAIKTGFWISVIVSFPLIIFPIRMSIHSLLFSREKQGQQVISSAADYIPQERFTAITVLLVACTLVVGILIPHIETILSITGALVGTFLCFVFPAGLYILSTTKGSSMRNLAKVIFVISIICMVASTIAVLSSTGSSPTGEEHKAHPGHEDKKADTHDHAVHIAKPFQLPGNLPGGIEDRADVAKGGGDKDNPRIANHADVKAVEKAILEQKNEARVLAEKAAKEEAKVGLPTSKIAVAPVKNDGNVAALKAGDKGSKDEREGSKDGKAPENAKEAAVNVQKEAAKNDDNIVIVSKDKVAEHDAKEKDTKENKEAEKLDGKAAERKKEELQKQRKEQKESVEDKKEETKEGKKEGDKGAENRIKAREIKAFDETPKSNETNKPKEVKRDDVLATTPAVIVSTNPVGQNSNVSVITDKHRTELLVAKSTASLVEDKKNIETKGNNSVEVRNRS